MSIFLGGNNLGEKEATELAGEIDLELSRATANFKPHKGKVDAFHVVLNEHTPGMRAGRTIAKLVELGTPTVVFQEDANINGGSTISRRTLFSLQSFSKPLDEDNYSRQVSRALGSRGVVVFPVDARHELISRMEAIVQRTIDADFFNPSERFSLESLTEISKEELLGRELETLQQFSFVMGMRDKSAVLQMLTFLTGVLNKDPELLVLMGLTEEVTEEVFRKVSGKQALTIGTVYGSAHLGIPVLLRNAVGRKIVKTHQLNRSALYLARNRYADHYLKGPDDEESNASRSVVEDFFFTLKYPGYINNFRVLPVADDRAFAKVAAEYCKEEGPKQALDNISLEKATRIALNKGLLIRV